MSFTLTISSHYISGISYYFLLDNCKKTGVVFDHLISSIDVVNCQSVKIQCLGQLSTVNIDKTDGCQVFLSEDSKYADVITAKSSEINILIPKGTDDFVSFFCFSKEMFTIFLDNIRRYSVIDKANIRA
ncbi:unnamed protein product [Schistosoma mattheei]|uniref:C-CAP/cofactor C-like domain-containing protein n=1 Tax=Schistosoma mattheei TaxID=31246 RepID=A0A3P7YUA2_9TREM|nr:unnamed protein product [Schistosoma mattheei]